MAERRHESEDLEDFEVLDSSDTLAGAPGDDPLDRGVATPERWSAPIRTGGTAGEQEAGESLDDLLAEEEPDVVAEDYGDDDFTDSDSPSARAGRLVAENDELGFPDDGDDGEAVGYDAGIDGGGATAEEAAVHVLDEEEGSGAE